MPAKPGVSKVRVTAPGSASGRGGAAGAEASTAAPSPAAASGAVRERFSQRIALIRTHVLAARKRPPPPGRGRLRAASTCVRIRAMRWENLSLTAPDAAAGDGAAVEASAPAAPPLPLALPGAVTRTFDTPGFAGMTFYEVRAKSII